MGERKLSAKPLELREADFKRLVNTFTKYPVSMRDEFIEYWTEPNKSGSLMKFEQEKTWDTGRRLARWDRNNFGNKTKGQAPVIHIETKKPVQNEPPAPSNDLQQLEQVLSWYKENPARWNLKALQGWQHLDECYRLIKEFRLWNPELTKQAVEKIKQQGDERYLKAAILINTFEYYGKTGWTFSDTLNLRK